MADQGKKYYQKGQTITDNSIKTRYQQVAVAAGATLAAKAIASSTGNMSAATFVATSGSAVAAGLEIYTRYKNQRLRAYYSHSGGKKYA